MAYKKINIYDNVKISGKVLSTAIGAGIAVIVLLMVLGSINGFTVGFDSGGGSAVAEQHLRYGEKVKMPPEPKREGYTFDGWYSDSARTKRFDFEKLSAGDDMMLYAGWTKNSDKVNAEVHEKNEKTNNKTEEIN